MMIEKLDFAEPFFTVKSLRDVDKEDVRDKVILINLAHRPVAINGQKLGMFQSVIVQNIRLENLDNALLVERFSAYPDEEALFEKVKKHWPVAYSIRPEERLKGVRHYLSPKACVGDIYLSMYHSGSVPLNVGLHKHHTHHKDAFVREVHTQIVGYGKMQQCREKDLNSLYLEEMMAPGMTHKPMYDANGNYPWHQFETVTPSIFLAIEMVTAKI